MFHPRALYLLGAALLGLDLTTEWVDGGDNASYIRAADYPPAARAALRDDNIVGQRGEALLCLWRKGGAARVCEVTPARITVIAEDIVSFARSGCAALGAVRVGA